MKRAAGRLIRTLAGDTVMVRSLNQALLPRLQRISSQLRSGGKVLDIGAKNAIYRRLFTGCRFETLDLEAKYQPDIVADVHKLDTVVAPETYDLIICTEVLEHTRAPHLAVDQMRNALRPGGTLIASTPFLVPYHPDPADFWRMTTEGWVELTKGFSSVDVVWHGNQPLSVWYLAGMGYGMPLRIFDGLVFAAFRGSKPNGVALGLICEAVR